LGGLRWICDPYYKNKIFTSVYHPKVEIQ